MFCSSPNRFPGQGNVSFERVILLTPTKYVKKTNCSINIPNILRSYVCISNGMFCLSCWWLTHIFITFNILFGTLLILPCLSQWFLRPWWKQLLDPFQPAPILVPTDVFESSHSWAKIPSHSSKRLLQARAESLMTNAYDRYLQGSLINMGNLDYNPNCSGDNSTYNRGIGPLYETAKLKTKYVNEMPRWNKSCWQIKDDNW